MAAVITGAVAVLAPGVHYAMAGPSVAASHPQAATLAAQTGVTQTPTPQAGVAAQAAGPGCLGVTPAIFPAQGFITNPNRSQGGHLWWRFAGDGTSVCIGTVVEFVQYNATATKTWRVIVYSARHPNGQVVAQRTFTLGRGWYWWSFGVHQVFSGLSAVCITASDSFGAPCLHFGPSSG